MSDFAVPRIAALCFATTLALAAFVSPAHAASKKDQAAVEALNTRMAAAEQRYRGALVRIGNADPSGTAESDAALEDMEDVIAACMQQKGCSVPTMLATYKRLLKSQADSEAAVRGRRCRRRRRGRRPRHRRDRRRRAGSRARRATAVRRPSLRPDGAVQPRRAGGHPQVADGHAPGADRQLRELPVHAPSDVAGVPARGPARGAAVRHHGEGIQRQGARQLARGRGGADAVHVRHRQALRPRAGRHRVRHALRRAFVGRSQRRLSQRAHGPAQSQHRARAGRLQRRRRPRVARVQRCERAGLLGRVGLQPVPGRNARLRADGDRGGVVVPASEAVRADVPEGRSQARDAEARARGVHLRTHDLPGQRRHARRLHACVAQPQSALRGRQLVAGGCDAQRDDEDRRSVRSPLCAGPACGPRASVGHERRGFGGAGCFDDRQRRGFRAASDARRVRRHAEACEGRASTRCAAAKR